VAIVKKLRESGRTRSVNGSDPFTGLQSMRR
jgi:hypothetical protein